MSDRYPDWQTYEKLYHKYLWSREPAELFDVALQTEGGQHRDDNCLNGKWCLDLCAGTGRLSREVLDYGGNVLAIETEGRMIKPSNFGAKNDPWFPPNIHFGEAGFMYTINDRTKILVDTVENAFRRLDPCWGPNLKLAVRRYEFAFCQQAVNIWLTPDTVDGLADLLEKGGVFVFTTFNVKPSKKPRVREYAEQSRHYVETSWLSERNGEEWVDHVQICEGFPAHYTSFRWIAPDVYDSMLSKRFNVYRTRDEKTDIYRCVRL